MGFSFLRCVTLKSSAPLRPESPQGHCYWSLGAFLGNILTTCLSWAAGWVLSLNLPSQLWLGNCLCFAAVSSSPSGLSSLPWSMAHNEAGASCSWLKAERWFPQLTPAPHCPMGVNGNLGSWHRSFVPSWCHYSKCVKVCWLLLVSLAVMTGSPWYTMAQPLCHCVSCSPW